MTPVIEVCSGRPTVAELTAVVVALAAATGRQHAASAGPTDRPATGWGAPGHGFRRALAPGDGAWRRAGSNGGGLR